MSDFKPIGSLADGIIANLKRQMDDRIDRADMRADSALDPDRPRGERMRDYLRYEDEAETAQGVQRRIAAWGSLKAQGFVK